MRTITLSLLGGALLAGCGGEEPDDKERPPREADSGEEDSGAGDTGLGPEDMPADPSPWTLRTSGSASLDLLFDTPSCTRQGSNYRQFWRTADGSHTFVLIAEVLGDYVGAGTYDNATYRVAVKLQEEAGGEGRYFATTADDTAALTVTFDDGASIWGEFTTTGLDSGAVTLSPASLPVWCLVSR